MTPTSEESAPFPTDGRLLGVDYGEKRVGIAISTPEQSIASPLEILYRCNDAVDARRFHELLDDYYVVGIVVGLPVHTNGEEGQSANRAREYGAWVKSVTGKPVIFWDERFTTTAAEDHLLAADLTRKQRAARRDKLAAMFLLQSFLDAPDRQKPPAPLRD